MNLRLIYRVAALLLLFAAGSRADQNLQARFEKSLKDVNRFPILKFVGLTNC